METKTLTTVSDNQVSLQGNLTGLLAEATAITVSSDEELDYATTFVKNVKTLKKAIEDDKDKIWRPAKTVTDEITARYKPILEDAKKIEAMVKDKIIPYQSKKIREAEEKAREERRIAEEKAMKEAQEIEDRRKKEEEAIRVAAQEKADELSAEGKDDEATEMLATADSVIETNHEEHDASIDKMINKADKLGKVEQKFSSGSASSTIVRTWTHELVDLSLVPVEFLVLDTTKVNQAIRANKGKVLIPGVRIYQKERLAIK